MEGLVVPHTPAESLQNGVDFSGKTWNKMPLPKTKKGGHMPESL